ncbi:hypothetical protein [Mycobacterium vicinigordonae]|uniref:DUF4345 domain-containing protein n=1 Tax=Mycobacterium vicinigordonae TaxID=1719132 RepID=A0A7D6HXV7_9MYCO|nr:hypothetical protein [Mycobacterium vicinigordonae]QLL05334.1 hypothetical protein H0P51_15750 [Mycobacterium vicinigordonae]
MNATPVVAPPWRSASWTHKALGAGALAMAVGAFTGHLVIPDRVADHYGWTRDRWYQRELGAFNAGLGYGVIAYARGHSDQAFVGSWGVAALLLALTRAAAIGRGARRGPRNVAIVVEDAALGIGALALIRRNRSRFTEAGH